MGQKPKARGSKSKARNRSAEKENQKSQSERFIETARSIGVDESGKEFERALETIVPSRKQSKSV